MSYTFTQTGSEIQAILDRAETGGQLDQDIAAKQDALTFDAVPTEGSTNPAESGGIYDAIQAGGATALAAFATDTVSGDIVSFPDGADGIPVKSFVGSIVPIQDLHGYDNPWPSGGGVNKIDADASYTAYKISDNTYQTTASNFYAIKIAVPNSLIGVECTFSAYLSPNASTSGFRAQAISGSNTFNGNTISGGTSGWSSVTFTPASGVTNLVTFTYGSGGGQTATVKEVQLEVGSSRTAFAPYSNICPISGWSGAEIYRTGVNVWDEEWEQGNINDTTGAKESGTATFRSKNYIPVKPNTTYYFCGVSPVRYIWAYAYDKDKNFIQRIVRTGGNDIQNTAQTTPDNCYFILFKSSNTGSPSAEYVGGLSINYPSSDTSYHAYDGQTINIDWTDEAGTVYVGTLTYIGGGLWSIQPTHEMVDMGTLTWTYVSSSQYFRTTVSDKAFGNENILSSAFGVDTSSVGDMADGTMKGSSSSAYVYVKDLLHSDSASFTAYVSGVQLLYELATLPDPIIVSASDLETLLGSNTVWLNCGSVTELTYRADTALYVQKLLNGGALSTLSMTPQPLSLGRAGVLLEQEEEPEVEEATEEPEEQPEEQAEEE